MEHTIPGSMPSNLRDRHPSDPAQKRFATGRNSVKAFYTGGNFKMKNKLIDLNNHLFAQLERLSDEDLKGDDLKAEIDRSKAIETLSTKLIENAALALKAQTLINDFHIKRAPEMLGIVGPGDE